ncbi:MAG: hypothetical protein AB7I19_09685 [Planctomycetota bacterium]
MMSRVVLVLLSLAVIALAWRLLSLDRQPTPTIVIPSPIMGTPPEIHEAVAHPEVVDAGEIESRVANALTTLGQLMDVELPDAADFTPAAGANSESDKEWMSFSRNPNDIMEYAAWRPLAFGAKRLYRSVQLNPRDHQIPPEMRETIDADLRRFQGIFERIFECVRSVRVSEASASLRAGRLTRMTRDLDPVLWDRIVGRSPPERIAELTDPKAARDVTSIGPSLKSALHSAFMREHKYYASVFVGPDTYLVRLDDTPMAKSVLENGELDHAKVMHCTYLLDAFQRTGCLTLKEREDLWRLFLLYMEEYKRSVAEGYVPNPSRNLLKRV